MKTRRILSLLLATVMAIGACMFSAAAADSAPAEEHPDLLAGDADRDGEVSILDATEIQRFLVNLAQLDELTQKVAKTVFPDEELSILDATNIQRWLAELIDHNTYEVSQTAYVWKDDAYISVIDDLKQTFDTMLKDQDYYGVLYVSRNGRTLIESAYGDDVAITIDTLFPIGSLSKQFCGAAVMMLRDQGKLSVNDTLEKYFPDYTIAKDVTLKNLLQMRSGIVDFMSDAQPMVDYDIKETYTAEENKNAILSWLYHQDLKFKPGLRYAYSNTNFFLLAEIVEQVSGMKYSDFIKKNIFEPLGMEHTGFYEELFGSKDIAGFRVDGFDPMEPHFKGLTQGAGDIVSCAKDMEKWMTSFGDYTLLSKESVKEITSSKTGYEYGWGVYGGSLSHQGGIATYLSSDLIVPEADFHFFTATTALDPDKTVRAQSVILNAVYDKTLPE